ncbi:DUF6427 family protein [Flavisericum labens]|uniref:DUF6427 family protein n=1 Tax=Flavisericum labens TaxID=3377112 RepID=UPI00387B302F
MITSFFNKSKPVNFVIVFFITLLAFLMARIYTDGDTISASYIFKQAQLLFIAYASILLLNFIVAKHSLTKVNNYEILLFSLFFLTIVETTTSAKVLLSNFFILLAFRRIISVRSQRELKKKYFDAAFWVAIACLFYFWAILFFILILASLILYTENNIRHWIIPFLGVATVFVISVGCSILLYNNYFELLNNVMQVSFDFSSYNSVKFLVGITMLTSFGLWSLIFYIQNIKKKKKANRASFKVVVLSVFVGFLLVILTPQKNGSEFLFLFAPLALVISNYIEILEDKWFKEIFVAVLFLVPFVILML